MQHVRMVIGAAASALISGRGLCSNHVLTDAQWRALELVWAGGTSDLAARYEATNTEYRPEKEPQPMT